MKKILQLTLAGLSLFATHLAGAATYQDGDVLLIFRESGYNDVEFDLGSISQFLNQPNGQVTAVSGWSFSQVTNVFGANVTGVSVIVAATENYTNLNRLAWLSSDNTSPVNDVTPSAWQSSFWSIIDSIGARPTNYLVPTLGTGWSYSINPSQGQYALAAYDNVVDGNGAYGTAIAQFGGNAGFTVEGVIPAAFGFWQIQGTNAIPKPAASYIGTFSIATNGTLAFVAGPLQPTIVGITRVGSVSSVSFTTQPAGNYSLVYTSTLGSSITTWPVVSGPVSGDGSSHTLTHTNSSNSAGFYGILHSP
jgi:hypothetical protein